MRDIEYLGKEKIGKLLMKFSGPAIIGMLVMASYNIVDRMFVGKGVGSLAISGIVVSFPIIIIVMAFGLLTGIGSAALVSIRLGEKNKEEAEKIVGQAFTLALIISSFLTILGYIFIEPMIIQFGGTGEVFKYAKDYTGIILFGIIFQIIGFSMNSIIRGEGNPKVAMLTMVMSGLMNIALNPIFIFVLHLGVRGSALATLITQIFSAGWILSYFLGKRSLLKLRLKNLKLDKRIVLDIFSIGISPFSMQIAGSIVFVIFNNSLLKYGGDLAVAAMGIGNSLLMVLIMPIMGLSQGLQPIVGYNYGAKQYKRVKEVLKTAILIATTICSVGFIIVILFSENIISAFGNNDIQLTDIFCHGARIGMLMLPLVGFQIISIGYFQSVGKGKHSMALTLSRQMLFLIPLLLILPKMFRLDGIWMAMPISDGASALFTMFLMSIEFKKLKSMERGAV